MSRRGLALIAAVAVVVGLAAPAGAHDTSSSNRRRQDQIGREINSLRSQVAEASDEEAALLGQLDEVETRRRVLDGKVAELDGELRAAQADLAAATMQLEALAAELAQAQYRVSVTRRDLAVARAELHERAVDAYVRQPELEVAQALLDLRDQRKIAAAQGYLDAVVRAQADLVERFNRLRQDLEDQEAAVQAKRDEAQAQRDVVARRTVGVEAARDAQNDIRLAVVAEERQRESLVNQVRSRKREFETRIAELRAESNSITALLRSVQRGQPTGTVGSGALSSPIPGAAISSRFGPRIHPIFGDVRVHTGVDFRASHGTPIRAAGDGVVVYAGPRGGYGNTIIIDHGGTLATLYAHQSGLAVGNGARVTRGQVIGRVGSTGYSTGPHLHFEVRVNGTPVDPLAYL